MVLAELLMLFQQWGYLGVFLASVIGNASIIFPVPTFLFIIASGAVLDPFLVGIIAGIGFAIGEMTSYALGYYGGKLAIRKKKILKKTFDSIEKRFDRHSAFLLIIFFAFSPFPFDILGIFCGTIKYDVKKFFAAMLIGKIAKGLLLAYSGYLGLEVIKSIFLL